MSKWFISNRRIYGWKLLMNPIYWVLIFLTIGLVLSIRSGVDYAKYKQATKNLDSEMYGEVIHVEFEENSLDVSDREYVATVKPTNSGIFNSSVLKSGETKYEYKMGEFVKIYYDSSNVSEYYIEHNAPTHSSIAFLIIGITFTCLGFVILAGYKMWKKRAY